MTLKNKESALHGKLHGPRPEGAAQRKHRHKQVNGKEDFPYFSLYNPMCTQEEEEKKKKHSYVTLFFPFTVYVGKRIQSPKPDKFSRAKTSTSVFRETSPGTARQENKEKKILMVV